MRPGPQRRAPHGQEDGGPLLGQEDGGALPVLAGDFRSGGDEAS